MYVGFSTPFESDLSMEKNVLIGAIACFAMSTSSFAIIGGYEPAANDTRFDAVCAIGLTANMMSYLPVFDCPLAANLDCLNTHGSGTLIAPSLVLMARHSGPDAYGCGTQS